MMTYNQNGTFTGLSRDPKPAYIEYVSGKRHSIPNGTKLIEIDTGITYRFDAEHGRWYVVASSGGSGEGDGEQYIDIDNVSF